MSSPKNRGERSSRGQTAANQTTTAAYTPVILPRGTDLNCFIINPKEKKNDSSDDSTSVNAFAGSSFESPPAADRLPRPPMHWIDSRGNACHKLQFTVQDSKYSDDLLTRHIKALLKVPVQV